jgi:CRP/FNR family transcriptional regulator
MNLQDIYLFSELKPDELASLKQIATEQSFLPGNFLFFEGDSPDYLHILTEGVIKVFKTDSKDNEVILHYFSPIHPVAELANLEHRPFPANAVFESKGKAIKIPYSRFEKDFLNQPHIALGFIRSLSRKLLSLESFINYQMILDSTSRLARFLYENESLFFKEKNIKLAARLGMTPETISRTLSKFKKAGIVFDKQKHKIQNRELLLDFWSIE